jgi:hypothetical protein
MDEADELLLSALIQGADYFVKKGKVYIDNFCIDIWEDICKYLARKGILKEVNCRIYKINENFVISKEDE